MSREMEPAEPKIADLRKRIKALVASHPEPEHTAYLADLWREHPNLTATIRELYHKALSEHRALQALVNAPEEKEKPAPLAVPVQEFMESGPDCVEWLIPDLIPEGGLVILASRPKAGKSLLTTNLALAAAKGGRFLGRQCKRANTLILQLEDPPTLIRERLKKMGIADGAFIRSGLLFTEEEWKALPEFIQENQIGLVVVDPLVFATGGGDENDAAKMSRFFLRLREIIFSTQASIIVVHHHRKSPGDAGDQIRGSSAILGAVDIALELVRESDVTPTATLRATSRMGTLEDEIIRLDVDALTWLSAGRAEDYRNGQRENQILETLEAEGETTIAELEEALNLAAPNFRPQLKNLVAKGLVEEIKLSHGGRGRRKYSYRLAPELTMKTPSENELTTTPQNSNKPHGYAENEINDDSQTRVFKKRRKFKIAF